LTAKVTDVDSRAESFSNLQRLENVKLVERLDKLEANIAQVRNIIAKISEKLKGNYMTQDVTEPSGASKDEIEAL